MVERLRAKEVAGINPLLQADQNRELFHTREVSRLIELVLTGLDNLEGKH